jgi:DNA-binding transcriptional MerR regulator
MASTDLSLFADDANGSKEKAPGALRTISEASELLDIPQHVLRFWETKFAQIKPLKRNGGRRFYRPQDLEVLQQVKHLLYAQGYTIKGAQKAIADFVANRGKDAVPVDRWATATFPPAHGNDNSALNVAAPAVEEGFDILSEIADLLAEPEQTYAAIATTSVDVAPVAESLPVSTDHNALVALRSELATMRDELAAQLRMV